jgi:hypothetical protein
MTQSDSSSRHAKQPSELGSAETKNESRLFLGSLARAGHDGYAVDEGACKISASQTSDVFSLYLGDLSNQSTSQQGSVAGCKPGCSGKQTIRAPSVLAIP